MKIRLLYGTALAWIVIGIPLLSMETFYALRNALAADGSAPMLCIDLTTQQTVPCPTAPDPLPPELLRTPTAQGLLHFGFVPPERPATVDEKRQRLAFEFVSRVLSNWSKVREVFLGPDRIYIPRELLLLQLEHSEAAGMGADWIKAAEIRFFQRLADDAQDLTVYRSPDGGGGWGYTLKGPLLLTWLYGRMLDADAPQIDLGLMWYARGSTLGIESEEPADAEWEAFKAAAGVRP